MNCLQDIKAMENVQCNICGNEEHEPVLTVPDCGQTLDYYQLVRCPKCDLTFVNPRPKNLAWSKYYPEDVYYAYQNNNLQGFVPKIKLKVKNYLMEWAGGYRNQKNRSGTGRIIDRLFGEILKDYLIGVVPSKYAGNLLDVGCGNGESLMWYRNHGWDTLGVEASKKGVIAARSKGLEIIESAIEEVNLPDNYFHAITMIQVLEHLQDPKGALSKLYRALRPGGLVVAGVPNFLCLDRQILGKAWLPLETPRHLYYFTPKSLKNLFRAVGFNVLQVRRKTKYGVSLCQIEASCRLEPGFRCSGSIAYLFTSPIIKALAPKDYSSTFISIYANKMHS